MTRSRFDIIIREKHEMVSVPGISLKELSRLCDCQPSVAHHLYRFGLLDPVSVSGEPLFSPTSVIRVRKALRLKRDLHLNFEAVGIVMELLDRIDELERRLER